MKRQKKVEAIQKWIDAKMPEQWPPKGVFLPGHGDFHQPDESISINRIKKALLIYICSICELDELECLG